MNTNYTASFATSDVWIARVLLSLWTSARRVERVPLVEVWLPSQNVALVETSSAYRAGDYL